MQQEMAKGAKGEPFAVQELYRKGPLTPSQLAASMKTTTGRVSALLSALEKKGQITRESDPDDRRVVHVNLTKAGRERAEVAIAVIISYSVNNLYRKLFSGDSAVRRRPRWYESRGNYERDENGRGPNRNYCAESGAANRTGCLKLSRDNVAR